MFTIKVTSDTITAKLDALLPNVRAAIGAAVKVDASEVLSRAQSLAAGDVLKVLSGKYLKSLKSQVRSTKTSVYGKVFSRDPRAALFEFGGSTPARDILPDAAKALAFMGSAGKVFAAIVHRPVVQYRPHTVIHEAMNELKDQVTADIQSAGENAVVASI